MSQRKPTKRTVAPPPAVINGARVLYYAYIRRPIVFSGRTYLYVGGREVGAVPRLVIAEPMRGKGIAIFHCKRNWEVIGHGGGHKSVSEAKRRAERMYPGIGHAWVRLAVSKRQARQIEREMWRGEECSFCNRIPPDFDQWYHGKRAVICNICAAEIYWEFAESKPFASSPSRGDYYPENGLDHVGSYVARVLAPDGQDGYALFFAPDRTRGFSLIKIRTMIEVGFVMKAGDKDKEDIVRSFFASSGIRPSRDYLADGGNTRILHYPVHGTVEALTTLTRSILQDVCNMSPQEPLFIHLRKETREGS